MSALSPPLSSRCWRESRKQSPLDIETALRTAFGQAYLVANSTTGFEIALGMPAWQAALADAGVTVEQKLGEASATPTD